MAAAWSKLACHAIKKLDCYAVVLLGDDVDVVNGWTWERIWVEIWRHFDDMKQVEIKGGI